MVPRMDQYRDLALFHGFHYAADVSPKRIVE
jgi:hypothetical protein